jgi:molybdopterin-guanine dinucleotide biosynthesis protein A
MPAAIILAGGRASRLGGVSKADVRVGGRRMLDIVLEAVGEVTADPVVVVAPDAVDVPENVTLTYRTRRSAGRPAGSPQA